MRVISRKNVDLKSANCELPTTNCNDIGRHSPLRINRFLAAAGLGSRRSCEAHILEGHVSINGSFCRDLATKVSEDDDVRVNGRQIHQAAHRYLLLHKPAGYVSTRSDRHAARTIFDLLPIEASHLFHVGRLDKESEGLLLLTNDGALAQNLLHPSRGVDKEYEVTLDQTFTPKAAAALKKGTWVEGAVARVESVHQLAPHKLKIVLHQGIKRQIRVMLGQLGFQVKRLVRTRIGPIKLGSLNSGSYRDLRPQELEALRTAAATVSAKNKGTKKARPKIYRLPKPSRRFSQPGTSEILPSLEKQKGKLSNSKKETQQKQSIAAPTSRKYQERTPKTTGRARSKAPPRNKRLGESKAGLRPEKRQGRFSKFSSVTPKGEIRKQRSKATLTARKPRGRSSKTTLRVRPTRNRERE